MHKCVLVRSRPTRELWTLVSIFGVWQCWVNYLRYYSQLRKAQDWLDTNPGLSRHDETSNHTERQIYACFILPPAWNHVSLCISCALVHHSKPEIYSLHMKIWIWLIHRATLMKICHHSAGLWIWHLLETEPCDILWYQFLFLGTDTRESADRKSVSHLVNHE